jgi:hypothetical protein
MIVMRTNPRLRLRSGGPPLLFPVQRLGRARRDDFGDRLVALCDWRGKNIAILNLKANETISPNYFSKIFLMGRALRRDPHPTWLSPSRPSPCKGRGTIADSRALV